MGVFTKNPAFPDPRGMNLQSGEKLCHNVITKLIWTQSWAKVRSLPKTHLRRNPEVTIATFVTVLSKIPSISLITSTEKNIKEILVCQCELNVHPSIKSKPDLH